MFVNKSRPLGRRKIRPFFGWAQGSTRRVSPAKMAGISQPGGWLYLAVVLDLFTRKIVVTRKIVGWAMRDHMGADLTVGALTMAIQRQKPPPGLLLHHSDSQYAATDYRKLLNAGHCWDNAPMESCFGTRVYHPRTGGAPSRSIPCPLNRGKVSIRPCRRQQLRESRGQGSGVA
jgi:transposase InsO family protein